MDLFNSSGATFSGDRKYRYALWRSWDDLKPKVMFIGLNPSTADETQDDPTIRRCTRFAKDWGFGGLYMMNLFAWRSTDPEELKKVIYPVGYENNRHLLAAATMCPKIIFSWGRGGAYLNRNEEVINMFPAAYCIAKTKDGHPGHPLYLKASLTPIQFLLALPAAR